MASQKRQRLQALQALHPCLQPGVAGLRPSIGEMLAARVELFRSFSYFWQPTCISPPFRYFRHSQAPKPRAFWWTLCQAHWPGGKETRDNPRPADAAHPWPSLLLSCCCFFLHTVRAHAYSYSLTLTITKGQKSQSRN
ncbi:hypothetical protein J3E69DRAFT_66773 [Trichoderma sp. SZMC 28015]